MRIPHESILRAATMLAPGGDVRAVPAHQRLAFAAVVAGQAGVTPTVAREALVQIWLAETGGMEAAAIDHRVQRGDFPAARFGGTSSGGWMARLPPTADAANPPSSPSPSPSSSPSPKLEGIQAEGLLYGYKLGAAEHGTRAWQVARLLQGRGDLTVEAAAFDKAVVAVKRRFQDSGVSLQFSLSRGTGLVSDAPDARVDFVPGRATTLQPGEDGVKELFETLYGNFTRTFTSAYLQRIEQREPTTTELAKEMKTLFAASGVDVQVYLRQLERSPDATDRALREALGEA
jgi:hypothetical protein